MKDKIYEFCNLKNKIYEGLKIDTDLYPVIKTDVNWRIENMEEISILEITSNNKTDKFVITKDKNTPIIKNVEDYTIVVAIDCIKVAFILNNKLELK